MAKTLASFTYDAARDSFTYEAGGMGCGTHPHARRTTGKSIAQWVLFVFVSLVLLVFPVFYATAARHSSLLIRLIPPITFTVLLLIWMLGRPLAILLRRRTESPYRGSIGVSVVIPCCNSADALPGTVRSILVQRIRPLEILLVENNSTDDTWETVQRLAVEHSEVRALRVDTKPGEYAASVAVNYGISQATHDLVVRMDDDTIMAKDFLRYAVRPFVEQEDVTAVAVNLRISNPEETVWTRLQSIEYLLSMELERRFQAFFDAVLICSGGLSVFRRDAIMKAGGFCSMPRWVSEDMDITVKAHRHGRVSMSTQAVGYTEVPATLKGLLRQRYRWSISGTVAMYLHREGLARSSYWYEGTVGFVSMPVRVFGAVRDLFGFMFPVYMWLLWRQSGWWLLVVLAVWIGVMAAQLLILAPALRSKQGLGYLWLLPLFPLAYGPLLLLTRFAGTWTGLRNIRVLRGKELTLEFGGLHPVQAETGLVDNPDVPVLMEVGRLKREFVIDFRATGQSRGRPRSQARRTAPSTEFGEILSEEVGPDVEADLAVLEPSEGSERIREFVFDMAGTP
jgi:cellulose synthase/poly-beta-1,6-N-acetylglucosamine synthase-like glycosyltransferase